MKKSALLIISIVMISGCLGGTGGETQTDTQQQAPQSGEVTVEITDSGFQPQTVTVTQGTTVTWENTGSSPAWPASNVHPTHTQYPGSGIEKCDTGEASEIFDACGELAPGESYSFTFDETGTWGYHDHRRPGVTGTVVVQ